MSLHVLTTADGARWAQVRDAAGEPVERACTLAQPPRRGAGAMPAPLFTARLAGLVAGRARARAARARAGAERALKLLETFR